MRIAEIIGTDEIKNVSQNYVVIYGSTYFLMVQKINMGTMNSKC